MKLSLPFVSRLTDGLKSTASNQINNAVDYITDETKRGLVRNILPIGVGLGTLGIGSGIAGYQTGKVLGQNQGYKQTLDNYGINPMNYNFSYMTSEVSDFGYKTPNMSRIKTSVANKMSKLAKSGDMVNSDPNVRKKAKARYDKMKSIPTKLKGLDTPVSKAKQKAM